MNFPVYQGYYGFGAVTVAEYTNLIRGIAKMEHVPGDYSSRFPMTAGVATRQAASDLIDMFLMRAEEMGWIVRETSIEVDMRGEYYAVVRYTVPETGPAVYRPPSLAREEEGPSLGATVLVGGIGLTALGLLAYAGIKGRRR